MKVIEILGKSSLFRQSSIYLISDGISKAIPFFFLPVISYYISPSDYGILTNYNVLVQILSVLCYSTTTVIIPVIYVKLNKEELKKFISNIVILNSLVSILLLSIIIVLSTLLTRFTSIPFLYQVLSLLSVLFTSFTQVNLVLWRCEEKPLFFGAVHISQTVIDIGVASLLIIIFLLGWQGRAVSMAFASIAIGLFSLVCLYKKGFLKLHLSRGYLFSIISFSLPLLPHGLSFWIKSGADNILLSNMCGLDKNALYSVAMTFGAIVSIFIVSFNNAFVPYLFKKIKGIEEKKDTREHEKIKIVQLYKWLMLGILLFVMVCFWFSYLVIDLVYQESYKGALEYLPYIFIGQIFMGYYSLFVNFIHYTQKTKVLGMITFSLTLIQVFISYVLILICGPIGSAISSAAISLCICLFVVKYATKVYTLPWRNMLF